MPESRKAISACAALLALVSTTCCAAQAKGTAAAGSSAEAGPAAAANADAHASATAPVDPLFDCYRSNSAWGLTYSGNVVDRNGQVWSYSQRGKALPLPTRQGERNSYGATDFSKKYEGSATSRKIDAADLAAHTALIEKAAEGKVTSTPTGVRDAGLSSCHAYMRDSATGRYRDVELGSDSGVSDVRVVNDAPEAKTLLDWLRTVGVAR